MRLESLNTVQWTDERMWIQFAQDDGSLNDRKPFQLHQFFMVFISCSFIYVQLVTYCESNVLIEVCQGEIQQNKMSWANQLISVWIS